MTREHKLALIVGFSLILVVGMLLSDHLSKARQAQIASVTPAETRVADAVVPPPADPLDSLASLPPPPAGPVPTDPLVQPPASFVAADPGVQASPLSKPQTPVDPIPMDSMIQTAAAEAPQEDGLIATIQQSGGYIRRDASGNIIFGLPSAAETSRVAEAPAGTDRSAPYRNEAAAAATKREPNRILAKNEPAVETIRTHIVKKNETLFEIAKKYYGNGNTWRELARYNNIADRNGLVRAGDKLRIPEKEALLGRDTASSQKQTTPPAAPSAKPSPAKSREAAPAKPGRIELATYTVKRGDTLGDISMKVFGTSKRWREIATLNKIKDSDNIEAGMVLKVPAMRG